MVTVIATTGRNGRVEHRKPLASTGQPPLLNCRQPPSTEHHTTITIQRKEWFDVRLAISLTYSACKDHVKGAQDGVRCHHSTRILQATPAEDLQSSQSRPTYAQRTKERRLGQRLRSQVNLDFPHSTDSQCS